MKTQHDRLYFNFFSDLFLPDSNHLQNIVYLQMIFFAESQRLSL